MKILDLIFFVTDILSDLLFYRSFDKWITVVGMHIAQFISIAAAVCGFMLGYPVIGIIGLVGTLYFGAMETRYFREHLEERRKERAAKQDSSRK